MSGADGPGWWPEVAPGAEKVRDGPIVRLEVVRAGGDLLHIYTGGQ